MTKLPPLTVVPHPLLRQRLTPVAAFDASLKQLATTMQQVMRHAEGVGLAANQIGVDARLLVYEIHEPFEIDGMWVPAVPFQTVVNPEITILDAHQSVLDEGCLSIPGLRGPVPRAIRVRLDGQDLSGKAFSRELHNYEARVVQHEVDHLNGILFLDHVIDPTKLYRESDQKES